ncbi:hypothetical protein PHIN3_49 [Sinorhizobium phage phiN3]|uniref:Uncharacterized protein n=1 Tax=Sinorhizobium phage phiN3 TaxID=1647405 RepID=A0A0F6WCJ4_9CAUD|nr:hypothetical protein AVT40_gp049 [Sinorhizobium phage phiN3]AKF13314.1 hypothetical protein PHIN3_49 [Sinorhizobium phage phiN3]
MTTEKEYITVEALRDLADLIEKNNPDHRIEIKRYIGETSFLPYIHIVLPMFIHKDAHGMIENFEANSRVVTDRVMPAMPHDLVGISPMAPPSSEIFKLRRKNDTE